MSRAITEFELGNDLNFPTINKSHFLILEKNAQGNVNKAVIYMDMAAGRPSQFKGKSKEDIKTSYRNIAEQFQKTALYLLQKGVVWSDLDPVNVMVDENNNQKVTFIDFEKWRPVKCWNMKNQLNEESKTAFLLMQEMRKYFTQFALELNGKKDAFISNEMLESLESDLGNEENLPENVLQNFFNLLNSKVENGLEELIHDNGELIYKSPQRTPEEQERLEKARADITLQRNIKMGQENKNTDQQQLNEPHP